MKVVDSGLVATSMRDIGRVRLHRPRSAQHVLEILSDAERRPVIVAGATDLCAQFNCGLTATDLIWLARLDGYERIATAGSDLVIGAGCTHAAGAAAVALGKRFPDLQKAWRMVASGVERIREWGTIGGNLMAGRTRYETLVLLMAAGAVLRFETPSGQQAVEARDFWEKRAPAASFLSEIAVPMEGLIALRYDRSLRPIMTLAICVRQVEGGVQAHAVIATQSLPPFGIRLDRVDAMKDYRSAAADHAAAAIKQLPERFCDIQSTRAYLARAGAVLLRRQLEGIGDA